MGTFAVVSLFRINRD